MCKKKIIQNSLSNFVQKISTKKTIIVLQILIVLPLNKCMGHKFKEHYNFIEIIIQICDPKIFQIKA